MILAQAAYTPLGPLQNRPITRHHPIRAEASFFQACFVFHWACLLLEGARKGHYFFQGRLSTSGFCTRGLSGGQGGPVGKHVGDHLSHRLAGADVRSRWVAVGEHAASGVSGSAIEFEQRDRRPGRLVRNLHVDSPEPMICRDFTAPSSAPLLVRNPGRPSCAKLDEVRRVGIIHWQLAARPIRCRVSLQLAVWHQRDGTRPAAEPGEGFPYGLAATSPRSQAAVVGRIDAEALHARAHSAPL